MPDPYSGSAFAWVISANRSRRARSFWSARSWTATARCSTAPAAKSPDRRWDVRSGPSTRTKPSGRCDASWQIRPRGPIAALVAVISGWGLGEKQGEHVAEEFIGHGAGV